MLHAYNILHLCVALTSACLVSMNKGSSFDRLYSENGYLFQQYIINTSMYKY